MRSISMVGDGTREVPDVEGLFAADDDAIVRCGLYSHGPLRPACDAVERQLTPQAVPPAGRTRRAFLQLHLGGRVSTGIDTALKFGVVEFVARAQARHIDGEPARRRDLRAHTGIDRWRRTASPWTPVVPKQMGPTVERASISTADLSGSRTKWRIVGAAEIVGRVADPLRADSPGRLFEAFDRSEPNDPPARSGKLEAVSSLSLSGGIRRRRHMEVVDTGDHARSSSGTHPPSTSDSDRVDRAGRLVAPDDLAQVCVLLSHDPHPHP